MQNKEIKQLINKNMNVTKTINCHNNQEVIQAPIGDVTHEPPPTGDLLIQIHCFNFISLLRLVKYI